MIVSWKFLPLVAVVALGVAVLMPGGKFTPGTAEADVGSFNAPDTVLDGSTIEVTLTGEDDVDDVDIDALGGNDLEIDDVSCAPISCLGEVSGEGSDSITIDTEAMDNDSDPENITITFDLIVDCDAGDVIELNAQDEADEDEATAEIDCIESNVTIEKQADDDTDLDFDFEISGTGADCDDDFVLADGESAAFTCDFDEEITVTEDLPSDWAVTIDCDDASALDVDEEDGTASFEVDQGDEVECTFTNETTGTVTPGTPDSLSLSVSSTNPACNLPVVVVATVRDDEGEGIGGVDVSFEAPDGSFTINEGTTSASGVVSTLYSPPNVGSEEIVLTATGNGESGTATITTNCEGEATATPVPPTVVPTQEGSIQPPSTGDAGLSSGSNSWLYAGAAFAAVFAFAGAIVARRRS